MSYSISVIVVNLNNAQGLLKTLASLENNFSSIDEIIVIDGGSEDSSLEIVQKFLPIITKFVSEPDRGIYDAMNKGILFSTSEYVCFINSGDILLNLPKNEYFFGDLIVCPIINDKRLVFNPSVSYLLNVFENRIHHQGALYLRSAILELGLYDSSISILADYDVNLKFLKNKSVFKIDNILMSQVDTSGISSSGSFINYIQEVVVRFRNINTILAFILISYSLLRYMLKKFI